MTALFVAFIAVSFLATALAWWLSKQLDVALKEIASLNGDYNGLSRRAALLEEEVREAKAQNTQTEAFKARFEIEHEALVSIVKWLDVTKTTPPEDVVVFNTHGIAINGKWWGHTRVDGKITDLKPSNNEVRPIIEM